MIAEEARAEQRRRIQAHYGPGHHVMNECALCGRVEWACTNHGQPDRVEFCEAAGWCRLCSEVAARAPEIYAFVAGVAAKLRRLIEEHTP